MSPAEKAMYDKGGDVYFQKSAWMDRDLNMEWFSRTVLPAMSDKTIEKVIFADNLIFLAGVTIP